jgi:predicted RecB family nuclease
MESAIERTPNEGYANGAAAVTIRLSKSKFVAGCQCLKRLYLQIHEPDLAAEPDGAADVIIERGREVGLLARKLFPGGIEVCSTGLDQAIRTTKELVANPEVPAIFEGTFEHNGVLVRVDILHRRKDGRWRLIEVKSTTDIKDHHLDDVGIQYRVLSRSGLDVASACLAHVNSNYIYAGGDIDPRQFFRMRNLTRRVQRLQPKLKSQLRSEFRVLAMPSPPDIAVGPHCTDPVRCEFFERCNPPRPHDHIGFLPRLHASAMEELEKMGIESIHEIPSDFELSEIQRRAATCVQTGRPWLDRDGLRAQLATLSYPIAYLDFETISPAIPRFAGTHPYQYIAFQWSAHIQQRGAESSHYEFLATDASDQRSDFVTSLCAALGYSGSIVVYNRQFEDARLAELAESLPEFTERIKKIQARLWDLLPIIRDHVYHPAFAGSYSLKSVLPALVPEMTYSGMEVADGKAAGLVWESLVNGCLGEVEMQRKRKALLDYCGQDTLGMLSLVETLQRYPN